jgi:hypothetical protein
VPISTYLCVTCSHSQDEYFKLSSYPYPTTVTCEKCGRVSSKEVSLAHTDLKEFFRPIEMLSIACNSFEEIREMQKAGIDCSDDPDSENFGVPIVKSRKEKLTALKVAGFQEVK